MESNQNEPLEEKLGRNVCLSGAERTLSVEHSGRQGQRGLETGGGQKAQTGKVQMCVRKNAYGSCIGECWEGDAIKSVSTRYSSNKVQDLKDRGEKETDKQTLGREPTSVAQQCY